MPFLDYFRCCCYKRPATEPTQSSVAETTHVKHPTMVSFDLETTTGVPIFGANPISVTCLSGISVLSLKCFKD